MAINIGSKLPALTGPKRRRQLICLEHINVTLEDAQLFQLSKTVFNQRMCDALAPVGRKNDQMLQVSPSAIVAGHDAADELPINFANKAQSGIALQVAGC